MKTMTLEYVHDLLASYGSTYMDAVHAIDAAIRERDELTAAVKLGKLCADVGADYMQRARKAEAALAALRDAGHAKGVPSLLCGRTPDGRHYVLTGEAESVNIVSDLIADAERFAEALRKIVDIDYVKRCCNNGIEVHYPDAPPEMECCGDPDVDFGPLAQIAMDALAARESPNS